MFFSRRAGEIHEALLIAFLSQWEFETSDIDNGEREPRSINYVSKFQEMSLTSRKVSRLVDYLHLSEYTAK